LETYFSQLKQQGLLSSSDKQRELPGHSKLPHHLTKIQRDQVMGYSTYGISVCLIVAKQSSADPQLVESGSTPSVKVTFR